MLRKESEADGLVAVTFLLPADHPSAPISLVGDFNDWTPGLNPMKQRPDGSLSTTVTLSAGSVAHFRYLGTEGDWFDDWDADDYDEHGGLVRV